MKVIGLTKITHGSSGYSQDGYVVIVSHAELESALERGYSNALKPLKVGDELNLAEIPNQRERIVAATKAMQQAYEQFVKASPVMTDLARVIGDSKTTGSAP